MKKIFSMLFLVTFFANANDNKVTFVNESNFKDKGSITGYQVQDYVLDLQKGDVLTINIDSKSVESVFLKGSDLLTSDTSADISIEENSKYTVRLLLMRNKARQGATADFDVSLIVVKAQTKNDIKVVPSIMTDSYKSSHTIKGYDVIDYIFTALKDDTITVKKDNKSIDAIVLEGDDMLSNSLEEGLTFTKDGEYRLRFLLNRNTARSGKEHQFNFEFNKINSSISSSSVKQMNLKGTDFVEYEFEAKESDELNFNLDVDGIDVLLVKGEDVLEADLKTGYKIKDSGDYKFRFFLTHDLVKTDKNVSFNLSYNLSSESDVKPVSNITSNNYSKEANLRGFETHDYSFKGNKGDLLSVKVDNPDVVAVLIQGDNLVSMSIDNDFDLVESSSYKVRVLLDPNKARTGQNAKYKIDFNLKEAVKS